MGLLGTEAGLYVRPGIYISDIAAEVELMNGEQPLLSTQPDDPSVNNNRVGYPEIPVYCDLTSPEGITYRFIQEKKHSTVPQTRTSNRLL